MKIIRKNPFNGKLYSKEIAVNEEQLLNWNTGMHIQYAMPDVSADDREFIISGILPDQWEDLFTEEKK